MRTIPFTNARANLKRVVDQVVDDVGVTIITRRDAPNVVVMSQEHYDSLMETLYRCARRRTQRIWRVPSPNCDQIRSSPANW